MEVKSPSDLDAKITFDKLKQIEKLESKIKKLSYLPGVFFACIMFFTGAFILTGTEINILGAILLLGSFIATMGKASMEHSECLLELAELKRS